MSTRSVIGVHINNVVRSIYCHFDGYPEHVGAILEQHYQSDEKRSALMDLGDLSVLGPELTPPDGEHHSFERKYPGVVVAYHRDRGEQLIEAEKTEFAKFMLSPPDECQDYTYLHDGDNWLVLGGAGWKRVSDVLKAQAAQ